MIVDSRAFRRFRRNRLAVVCGVFVAGLAACALFAPMLAPYRFDERQPEVGALPPSWRHPFGTDLHGRDLLSRMLYGSRISLAVGVAATLVSLVIGVSYGSVAGYRGGALDNAMMRLVDVLYGLPFMFFVIILMMVAGRSLINLFLALGAVQWLTMSRIVRSQVMSLKEREFVEAARAAGASGGRILFRHILPNLLGPVIVYAALNVPAIMLEEAFLSFLGLGVQEPTPSWGLLVWDGVQTMEVCPWLIVFPAGAFTLTLFALSFLGDGLRDAFDPRSRA